MLFHLLPIALLAPTTLAAYSIVDNYTPDNFADKFTFYTGNDPTNGYVNYVDRQTAVSSGLYSASSNEVYIGVDHNNTASGRGRDSVRIESKESYQHGLIILDLAHMPASTCGTWPAFWLLSTSATWPNGGEVDIIEGVNTQNSNSMAVHTNSGCSIKNTAGMTGEILTPNCDVAASGQANNQGCVVETSDTRSYGDGFNTVGGGVYATEWTSNGILIWFFPRTAIPNDLSSGNPDPSSWGLPMARFEGDCDWDEKVVNQQIIFDMTFCGDWAGQVFSNDATCQAKASSCQNFVQNNPSAFSESFWTINSLKVYQQNNQATPTTSLVTTSSSLTPTSQPTTSQSSFTTITLTTTTSSFLPTVTTTTASSTSYPTSTSTIYVPPTSSLSMTSTTSTASTTATISTSSMSSVSSVATPTTFETKTRPNGWTAWAAQQTNSGGDNPWSNFNNGPNSNHWGPP